MSEPRPSAVSGTVPADLPWSTGLAARRKGLASEKGENKISGLVHRWEIDTTVRLPVIAWLFEPACLLVRLINGTDCKAQMSLTDRAETGAPMRYARER